MDAQPAPDGAAPLRAPSDASLAVCDALSRVLADGVSHALPDLVGSIDRAGAAGGLDAVVHGIDTLRRFGMSIVQDGATVRSTPFRPLDRSAIQQRLDDSRGAGAWTVRVAFAVDSTNSELMQHIRTPRESPAPGESVLLVAEVQRAGRGRLGRRWVSAPGVSLTASFAIRIRRRGMALEGASLTCGLAVHEVLAAHGVRATLKWPNDVLVDRRKLGGILVEVQAEGADTTLVVGIGLNIVGPTTSEFGDQAIDLRSCGVPAVDRNALVADLAIALEAHLRRFEIGGFEPFAALWAGVDAYHDADVVVGPTSGPWLVGIARGVDRSGALLLDVDGVRRRIIAGDVSLRSNPRVADARGSACASC